MNRSRHDREAALLEDALTVLFCLVDHLYPGVVGLALSSLHRRTRKLRGFLEPLRRALLTELVGEPETLLIGCTSNWTSPFSCLLLLSHPLDVLNHLTQFFP